MRVWMILASYALVFLVLLAVHEENNTLENFDLIYSS